MSDVFDHACDVFDQQEQEEYMLVEETWVCPTCNRRHPDWHTKCWWCEPTDTERRAVMAKARREA